jgi:hypothetical protein
MKDLRLFEDPPHRGYTPVDLYTKITYPFGILFLQTAKSYLDQNFLRITNPVSDLTGDQ